MSMNYAFTARSFQGTDMAVISGAWKSILMTQETICDQGNGSAWNNKEYTSPAEKDKLFLWPQPHLRNTIIWNETRTGSKPSHSTALPGETPLLKKNSCWNLWCDASSLPGFHKATGALPSHLRLVQIAPPWPTLRWYTWSMLSFYMNKEIKT